jgi:hypothetical protein
MPTAEELFTDTFRRFMANWNVIISLRQVASAVLPVAEPIVAEQHRDFLAAFAQDPRSEKIFVNRDGSHSPLNSEVQAIIREGMTNTALTQANAAIDAASIVFAQSILDDCAMAYCKVCSLAKPDDWEQQLDKRKVDFSQLREKPYEAVRQELIEFRLAQLERESLMAKVDLLFTLCQPSREFDPIGNYAYDRERLLTIDAQRHRIIHQNGFGEHWADVDSDLEFISRTANYLMALVNHRYGVRISEFRLAGTMVPPPGVKE